MAASHEVFHRNVKNLRKKIHLVLVRPELSRNVGASSRACANMGINGNFCIVGTPNIVDQDCRNVAKHSAERLNQICFFDSLEQALIHCRAGSSSPLSLAATARSGSPHRPHPFSAREGVERATAKLFNGEVDSLTLVFGPEGDGLSNHEVDLCDWVVTIASEPEYRSLNLAQAVMVFAYEVNVAFTAAPVGESSGRPNQKIRLIQHLMQIAEEVGFLLPNDPFKMRPRLEEIFSQLPNHIQGIRTLHGLLDQVRRSVQRGSPDYKGRYKAHAPNRP